MPFTTIHPGTDRELSVYHEVHGDGPLLVNIGGSGGDLRTSRPGRSPFNRSFCTLHFDQRGLGQTDKPAGPYTMRGYAEDVVALTRELGWERFHVVGTSFGGMVAQHLAIHHPELVDRLVLNCTSPGGTSPSFPLHTLQQLDVEARIEISLGLNDCRWDPGRDDPIPGLGPFYDLMVQGMRVRREGDDLAGYTRQLEARAGHDTQRRLHQIESPTLVCAGEFDDLAPLPNSVELVERIPNAELRVFDGGHLFLLQDRSAFATIISWLTS